MEGRFGEDLEIHRERSLLLHPDVSSVALCRLWCPQTFPCGHVSKFQSPQATIYHVFTPQQFLLIRGCWEEEEAAKREQEKRNYFSNGEGRNRRRRAKEEGFREQGFLFLLLGQRSLL